MTIADILKYPVGYKFGGGFVLTVKKTKKSVKLPNGRYIHTVVLFDETGEILADFKDPSPKDYSPLHKGQQPSIIVAKIQAADSTGRAKVDQTGTKIFIDQYTIPAQIGEPDLIDEYPDWQTTVRGKVRHGVVCSLLRAGFNIYDEIPKGEIETLVEFIMTGE